MNDMSRMLKVMKKRKHDKFILATVVRVQGSSYRHEGAKMLIDAKGETFGTISAGCLEQDIVYHAQEIIESNSSQMIRYNLASEDEVSWGQSPGCNGIVDVYLEAVGWNLDKNNDGRLIWSEIDKKLNTGLRVAAGVRLNSGEPNKRLYCCDDGELYSSSSVNDADKYLRNALTNFITQQKHAIIEDGDEGAETIIMELYKPKAKLFIFGAGTDVEPLVEYANRLDFSVCLIDPRSSKCNEEKFPFADQLIVEFTDVYLQNNPLPSNSFALIMTHNFHWDQKILQILMKQPPHFMLEFLVREDVRKDCWNYNQFRIGSIHRQG